MIAGAGDELIEGETPIKSQPVFAVKPRQRKLLGS